VDQHNSNVRKQSTPMTVDEFKRNLSKMNNKDNFDDKMLTDIYNAIKSEEIVMPAEHVGVLKDHYMWKMMLKRSQSQSTTDKFIHSPAGSYNYDIFTIIWGQTMAALSFVFEKSHYELVINKAMQGFNKCARIAAHYLMSDVFDNLVISLCKFTTLLNNREWVENLPIQFGLNRKARLAATVVFSIAHVHGDILRDGWKNLLECIIHLYKANLLPSVLVEVEDFLDPSGRTTLIKEQITQTPKTDIGLFSSLAFLLGGNDSQISSQKQPTVEEQEAIKVAQSCIEECHLEQLLQETKFLIIDSLNELIKALIYGCQGPEQLAGSDIKFDQDSAVFCLELLVKVVLQNRDRVTLIWTTVRHQFYSILVNANGNSFFVERACVGLLRIAARLLRREELASEVLASLRMFLLMKPPVIHQLSSEIAFGLHELLRTNAANIHKSDDWFTLFSLLEVVGAGAHPPPVLQTTMMSPQTPPKTFLHQTLSNSSKSTTDTGAQSDSECCATSNCQSSLCTEDVKDKGYTSDTELYHQSIYQRQVSGETDDSNIKKDYIVVSHDDLETIRTHQSIINQYKIDLNEKLSRHDRRALIKCCETLTFLVRDTAHVTPENFEYCIHCIRTFIEATVSSNQIQQQQKKAQQPLSKTTQRSKKRQTANDQLSSSSSSLSLSSSQNFQQQQFQTTTKIRQSTIDYDEDDDDETIKQEYQSLSLQLLDLMHTLHTRASSIYKSYSEEKIKSTHQRSDHTTTSSILWFKCWCPILQGMARLCCDYRRPVRSSALNYLQRSVLLPELHILSAQEWESVFNKVLFPLLLKLLESININDLYGVEETRVRVSQLLCRIFLQHLTPLLTLPTFTALWLTILDFTDKYMKSDQTDMLRESVRESLKNMLLVMHTTGLFNVGQQLTTISKDRIHSFLPGLWDEVFKMSPSPSIVQTLQQSTSQTDNISQETVTNSNETSSVMLNNVTPSASEEENTTSAPITTIDNTVNASSTSSTQQSQS
ncbi:unnamed protein product, partial [Didymodactylos carnosus]